METVYIACAVVLTVLAVILVVYLVLTLNQVRATARQAEEVLANLNRELATVSKVTGFASAMVERFTTPWFKIGSWVASAVSSYVIDRAQKRHTDETGQREECKEQCCASEGGKNV